MLLRLTDFIWQRKEFFSITIYSSDLVLSDFHLFSNMQKWLAGKKFSSNTKVITETNAYFEGLLEKSYTKGIKELEYRWRKCIMLKGNYVEE